MYRNELNAFFTGALDLEDQPKKHWTARMKEYSRQDLIAICEPYMVALAVPAISASYVYDPSMRLLLFTALPSHLQNWATFGLCLLEEVRFLLMFLIIGVPILQAQVITIDLVSSRLQILIRKMEK